MHAKHIHLLIGVGEVGLALHKLLKKDTSLYWFDISPTIPNNLPESLTKVDVLHITFPQEKNFIEEIKSLQKKYKPQLTVVHSTTVPGSTSQLGPTTVHSPILGQHDCLYKHIKTFRKTVGPNSAKAAKLTKFYLGKIFDLEFFKNSKTTEAAKVLSLVSFAVNIEMARYSQDFCSKLNVSYDEAVTKFLTTYNEGYSINKLKKFTQPLLTPPQKKIGGSCVIPGVLKSQIVLKSDLTNAIIKKQKN